MQIFYLLERIELYLAASARVGHHSINQSHVSRRISLSAMLIALEIFYHEDVHGVVWFLQRKHVLPPTPPPPKFTINWQMCKIKI